MPDVAAMVGHGGYGTTTAALAAGVPQVLLPLFASDQWANAGRVRDIGAGLSLEAGPQLAAELPAAVHRVIHDPALRRAAEAMRDEVAGLPLPDELVAALVDAASA